MSKTITSPYEQTIPVHFKNKFSGFYLLYLIIVLIPTLVISCLPFIYADISIQAGGMIRPISERAIIRPVVSGIVDKIFVKEGQFVQKGTLLLLFYDTASALKRLQLGREIQYRQVQLADLRLLINRLNHKNTRSPEPKTTLYRRQWDQYVTQRQEWRYRLRKMKEDLIVQQKLAKEKIITAKEMSDRNWEYSIMTASFGAFELGQVNTWLGIADKYLLELEQMKGQYRLYTDEERLAQIRSPVSGRVQYIQDKYSGTVIPAGEMICSLSPDTLMIAECWISANDIGFLSVGQQSVARVHSFNYNYFGTVPGRIISIDDDFTLIENKPMFKVRCSVDRLKLNLKNGFTGNLKKGMTLDIRFIMARRSLWQLLYDQADDWLNPSAPEK